MKCEGGSAMNPKRRPSSHRNILPHFIPQEVLERLRAHLYSFPDQNRRMIVLLLESGIRVNELCVLPFDCLVQDAAGNWFLRFNELKTRQERSIPLTRSMVAVIREQQQALEPKSNAAKDLLFPNSKGRPFSQKSFITQINRLALENNICDMMGNVWRFRAQQFRYTVAARMVRDNVPFSVIQQHFGHQAIGIVFSVYQRITGLSPKELIVRIPWRAWVKQFAPLEGTVDAMELPSIMRNAPSEGFGYCTLPLSAIPCGHPHCFMHQEVCLFEHCTSRPS